jgi:molecular chaperone Hsp33
LSERADFSLPFDVPPLGVFGRLVRLGPTLDRVLGPHAYPEPVSMLLAELLALAAALSSVIKVDGTFTLQIKSDGAIGLMVADYRAPGVLRGYAQYDGARVAKRMGFRPDGPLGIVPRLLGAGHLAFTLDQGPNTERYQGIVALEGSTLAECVNRYFRQSEQTKSVARTAVRRTEEGWRAGALLVQKAPESGSEAEIDAWHEAMAITATVTDDELLGPEASAEIVADRLFRLAGGRSFERRALVFGCRCSRDRVRRLLASFSPEEVDATVVDGRIEVKCEFCSSAYRFDRSEIEPVASP